MWAEAMTLSCG
ncbi:hypothetical protein YPPY113_1664, partial [Yersinia pestis PY-113]